tara:strand:+ start:65 stop:379 length:315 start_codon:yes stop_codon:yes gene_type:complete
MDFTWVIRKAEVLDKLGETKVISNVEWELTAKDGEKFAVRKGKQSLDTTDLSGFTSFDDLTQAQLATWVQNAMGSDYNKLKLDLINQLDHVMTNIHEIDTEEMS